MMGPRAQDISVLRGMRAPRVQRPYHTGKLRPESREWLTQGSTGSWSWLEGQSSAFHTSQPKPIICPHRWLLSFVMWDWPWLWFSALTPSPSLSFLWLTSVASLTSHLMSVAVLLTLRPQGVGMGGWGREGEACRTHLALVPLGSCHWGVLSMVWWEPTCDWFKHWPKVFTHLI